MSKSKEGATVDAVLNYLNGQNRPYSVTDVLNNLHKEHGKTAIQKALDQLVESGQIKEKTYGKQKVYVADQSQFPNVNDEEIKRMDLQIQELNEQLKAEQLRQKEAENQLNSLNSSLTLDEIKAQTLQISEDVERYKVKLTDLTQNAKTISPAAKEKICKENERCLKEWRKRKRIALDIVNAVLEGYPKGKKALFEEVGVETDEDVGVSMPLK